MKLSKLLLVTASSLLLSQTAFSQSNFGHFYLGGESSLTFSYKKHGEANNQTSQNQVSTTQFEITPKVGMFASNKLLIGISLPITYSNTELESSFSSQNKVSRTQIVLAPFINYYLSDGNIQPFLTTSVGVGTQTQSGVEDFTIRVGKFNAGGGVAIFLNDIISLDLSIQYEYLAHYPDGDNPTNYHQFSKGIDFKFGVSSYL